MTLIAALFDNICGVLAVGTLAPSHWNGLWTSLMTWEFFRYADLRILPISFCFLRLYVCSQTHVPHDGTDTPLAQYEALLDPIRLLSTIPRTLGTSTMGAADNVHAMQKDSMLRRKSMLAAQTGRSNSNKMSSNSSTKSEDSGMQGDEQEDDMSVNFTQFYQLILQITQIVYKDLYETDSTVALNNFLIESLVPLMAWTRERSHNKRGSTDVLVKEERIALLLATYSPNIWKVFLMYAHNSIKKAPEEGSLRYPDTAKMNERTLFGLPAGCPNRMYNNVGGIGNSATKDYLVISETSFLRLCMDYGLCPQLQTVKQCKDIFSMCNRPKYTIKTVTKDMQVQTRCSFHVSSGIL
jgi:hypothetical protein